MDANPFADCSKIYEDNLNTFGKLWSHTVSGDKCHGEPLVGLGGKSCLWGEQSKSQGILVCGRDR